MGMWLYIWFPHSSSYMYSDTTSLNNLKKLSVVLCPKSSALKKDMKSETEVI